MKKHSSHLGHSNHWILNPQKTQKTKMMPKIGLVVSKVTKQNHTGKQSHVNFLHRR